MSGFCPCNFEAAMGHPAFKHKRGEPGFACKYDPDSPEFTGGKKPSEPSEAEVLAAGDALKGHVKDGHEYGIAKIALTAAANSTSK